MQLKAPCKINLGLHILNRRPDGFHDIESIMYPIPLCDVITVKENSTFHFSSTGIRIDGEWEDNLCVKAYRLMRQHFNIPPVALHLEKNVPAGAGLGGGSADASYTLMAIRRMFNIDISNRELKTMAASLGSDCPFFIDAVPSLATGRGDILTPVDLNLSGLWLLIAKPLMNVSTAEAYRDVKPVEGRLSPALVVRQPVVEWQGQLCNDFEYNIMKSYPAVGRIKAQMLADGALFAAMSGSGSAVYGIFGSKPRLIESDDIDFQVALLLE